MTDPSTIEPEDASIPSFESEFSAYRPFPLDCLPVPVRDYVQAQARKLECDPAAVALPSLAVLASGIGGSRTIRLDEDWMEPAVLWTAVIADQSARNHAPIDAAVRPLEERKSLALRIHARKLAELESAEVVSDTNRNPDSMPKQKKPTAKELQVERCIIEDWGTKSVLRLLAQQPRGALVRVDELDAWLGPIRSSSSRRANDIAQWVHFFQGTSVEVEQRPGTLLHAPLACVSLTGTVETETLAKKFLAVPRACPLTSRLLFAAPTSEPAGWKAGGIGKQTKEGYAAVVQRLQTLTFEKLPDLELGRPKPRLPQNEDDDDWVGYDLNWNPIIPETERGPDGYHASDETVARLVMQNFRWCGPGEGPDGKLRPYKYMTVQPVKVKPPPAPDFETLMRTLEALSTISRHKLQGLVFGKGFGAGCSQPDLAAFFADAERYLAKYGKADPRPEKAKPQTGLAGDADVLSQDLTPVPVDLTPEALGLFEQFMERRRKEQMAVEKPLQPWFANLSSQAARLALVLHLTRWASGEAVDPNLCDETSMGQGIKLAWWFAGEARRIYALFCIGQEDKEQFGLADWLSRRGGEASARDLSRSNRRKYPTEETATSALDTLAKRGVGAWRNVPPGPKGGRPSKVLSMRREEEENGERRMENGECKMEDGVVAGGMLDESRVVSGAICGESMNSAESTGSAECGVRSAEWEGGCDAGGGSSEVVSGAVGTNLKGLPDRAGGATQSAQGQGTRRQADPSGSGRPPSGQVPDSELRTPNSELSGPLADVPSDQKSKKSRPK